MDSQKTPDGAGNRRRYSDEFKRDAVRLVVEEGYSLKAACQAVGVCVDLVHQRQVAVAASGSDLINANGRKLRFFAVNDPPANGVADTAVNPIPTGIKDACRLAPGQSPCPGTQEPFVGRCHLFLATGPLQRFGFHAALPATDPPHRVNEKHLQPQDGNKLKLSGCACIVSRTGTTTLAAAWLAVFARANVHKNPFAGQPRLAVDEPLERVTIVENSLQ